MTTPQNPPNTYAGTSILYNDIGTPVAELLTPAAETATAPDRAVM